MIGMNDDPTVDANAKSAAFAGCLVVTVDLEPTDLVTHTGGVQGVHKTANRIIDLMDRLDLPATWSVAEPATSALAARLWESPTGHEVALLGEPTWVGSAAGRGPFARELSRRIAQTQTIGRTIVSLTPRDVLVDDNLDLVVQHRLSAVRGIIDVRGRASRPATPHPLHKGLWEVPGSLHLPGDSRIVPGGGRGRTARSHITSAARRGDFFHLVVDIPSIVEAGRFAERTLVKTLCHTAALAHAGKLCVTTLASLAAVLSKPLIRTPQRSILRAAG